MDHFTSDGGNEETGVTVSHINRDPITGIYRPIAGWSFTAKNYLTNHDEYGSMKAKRAGEQTYTEDTSPLTLGNNRYGSTVSAVATMHGQTYNNYV